MVSKRRRKRAGQTMRYRRRAESNVLAEPLQGSRRVARQKLKVRDKAKPSATTLQGKRVQGKTSLSSIAESD